MTGRYRPPAPLASHHVVSVFECRSAEQTEWLRRHAHQSAGVGTSRVFVVTESGSPTVVAYYAWCMARHPQPVALLARLGVDMNHERRGLGAALLRDVFARMVELSTRIGCRGLLVHAESREARDFYVHLVPEFEASPTDDLHLVLLMKDIRRTLRG